MLVDLFVQRHPIIDGLAKYYVLIRPKYSRFKRATRPCSYRHDRSGTNIHIGEVVHYTCLAAMRLKFSREEKMGLANQLMLYTLCKG